MGSARKFGGLKAAFEYIVQQEKAGRIEANAGDKDAMNLIGNLYYNGEYGAGVDQNYDEARKWAQSGAEAGDSSSMYLLAMMDKNGEGISEPDAKSATES